MVVTTPLRRGMPLIRSRTGDMGRILAGQCACTPPLRRRDPLVWRTSDGVSIGDRTLTLRAISECCMPCRVWTISRHGSGKACCASGPAAASGLSAAVTSALADLPAVVQGLVSGALELEIETRSNGAPAIAGLGKRCLKILGGKDE